MSSTKTPGGGFIVLGVDEENGFATVGVEDPKKIQNDLASMCREVQPRLNPRIETVRVEGKPLVSAIAELPSSEKPCFYTPAGLKNGAFVRVADG